MPPQNALPKGFSFKDELPPQNALPKGFSFKDEIDQPGVVQSVGSSFLRGAGGTVSGVGSAVDAFNRFVLDSPTDIGGSIQRGIEKALPLNPDLEGSFFGDVLPSAFGSAATFLIPGGALGVGAKVAGAGAKGIQAARFGAAALTGAAAQGGQGFRESKDAGASDRKILTSTIANAGLGLTESLPVMAVFSRLDKGTGGLASKILKGKLAKLPATREALSGAIEESLQELGQTVGSNVVARALYDPDRDITEGAFTAAAAGGIVGGGISFGTTKLSKTFPEKIPGEEVSPDTRVTLTGELAAEADAEADEQLRGLEAELNRDDIPPAVKIQLASAARAVAEDPFSAESASRLEDLNKSYEALGLKPIQHQVDDVSPGAPSPWVEGLPGEQTEPAIDTSTTAPDIPPSEPGLVADPTQWTPVEGSPPIPLDWTPVTPDPLDSEIDGTRPYGDDESRKPSVGEDIVAGEGILQRVEEPGVERADFSKPQGIYTNPAGRPSAFEDLGGDTFYWKRTEGANVLVFDEAVDDDVVIRQGAISAGSGVWAFRDLSSAEDWQFVKSNNKKAVIKYAEDRYPEVAWDRYFDKQEVIEGLGGMLARDAGYDAIELKSGGSKSLSSDFSEYVGLTENSMTPIDKPGSAAKPTGLTSGGLQSFAGLPSPKMFVAAVKDVKTGIERVRDVEPTRTTGDDPEVLGVQKVFDESREAEESLGALNPASIARSIKRFTIDTSGNVKKKLIDDAGKAGQEVAWRHQAIRGAGAKAERIISAASNKVYGGLTVGQTKTLDDMIQSRSIISASDLNPELKNPGGFNSDAHRKTLADLEQQKPEEFKDLTERADAFFAETESHLQDLFAAGLIDSNSLAFLMKRSDYSMRKFLDHIDPEKTYDIGGKKITVSNSGIKRLKGGSEGLIAMDSRRLLAEIVTRKEAIIARNKANQALLEVSDSGLTAIVIPAAKGQEVIIEGKPLSANRQTPKGHQEIDVMVDGQKQTMWMKDEYAKEWVAGDPAINAQVANILGVLSGAKVLRAFATGYNPGFALTNFPRDIAHIWVSTHEYSKHLPYAGLQMSVDLAATAKDAATKTGAYEDYINEGGGLEWMTHQGFLAGSAVGGSVGDAQKVAGYAGETSEIWTRLALRHRAIKNGFTPFEATQIARGYLDFSQGGSAIKAADTGFPYINAGIQATRGIVRSASENPSEFLWKVAQVGALSMGLYFANTYNNEDAWDDVPEEKKKRNFIITFPEAFSYEDSDGNTRHRYLTIAKDQGQMVFTTFFEGLAAKIRGDDYDWTRVLDALEEIVPMMPGDLPPMLDAFTGYQANKNFWYNQDIWKGAEVEPSQEFTASTNQALVEFGKQTGMSPVRTKYALEQLFTSSNVFSSAAGAGIGWMFKEAGDAEATKPIQERIAKAPIVKRLLKDTNPLEQERKAIQEAKVEEATRRLKQNRTVDELSKRFFDLKTQESADVLAEFVSKQPKVDQERLERRVVRAHGLQGIPERRWWLDLAGLTPEVRAAHFFARFNRAEREERIEMLQLAQRVPGIDSDRFQERLIELAAQSFSAR